MVDLDLVGTHAAGALWRRTVLMILTILNELASWGPLGMLRRDGTGRSSPKHPRLALAARLGWQLLATASLACMNCCSRAGVAASKPQYASPLMTALLSPAPSLVRRTAAGRYCKAGMMQAAVLLAALLAPGPRAGGRRDPPCETHRIANRSKPRAACSGRSRANRACLSPV